MKKLLFTLFTVFVAVVVAAQPASTTLNPVADGFVKQADNTYAGTFENMELSSYAGYARELFLDFDLTSIAFNPQHATLRLYLNSFGNANPVIIAAYAATGNAISEGLTFTNRPVTGQYRTADVHASQGDAGTWASFDFSDYIEGLDIQNNPANKQIYFRIVVVYPTTSSTTSPLITVGSIESANKPELVLNNEPVPGIYEVPYAEIESLFVSVPFVAAGDPKHAFNGAGLLPGMKHVTAGDNMAWRNSSGTYPMNLMVKLKKAATIAQLHVWNMNWLFGTASADYTVRGVKDVNIFVSTASDDMTTVDFTDSRWQKVTPDGFQFVQATGSTSYTGELISINKVADAHWIAFNVLSNFAATTFAGLSEVKLYREISADSGTTTAAKLQEFNKLSVQTVGSVLRLTILEKGMNVGLYDIRGRLLYSSVSNGDVIQWNVPAGVYIIKANDQVLKAVQP